MTQPLSVKLNAERASRLAALLEAVKREHPTMTKSDLVNEWIDQAYEKLKDRQRKQEK